MTDTDDLVARLEKKQDDRWNALMCILLMNFGAVFVLLLMVLASTQTYKNKTQNTSSLPTTTAKLLPLHRAMCLDADYGVYHHGITLGAYPPEAVPCPARRARSRTTEGK